MNAWEHFVEANNGQPPHNAFDLINYSRSTDSTETLSYNQGLSIYQKHSMDNRKKYKPANKKKRKKKKNNKNTKNTITPIPISVTSPLIDRQNTPSFSPTSTKTKKLSKKSKSSNNLILNTPTRSSHSSSDDCSNEIEYNVNDYVLLSKHREGIIKFIGFVHFTTGKLYGIELINGSVGKHDGMIEHERYFQTQQDRGIFVRKKQIRRKMRSKDYSNSSRLRRADSIESINGSSIIKMIPSTDIKMIHGGIYDHSTLFETTHTMIIKEVEPTTQRGRTKKQQRSQHDPTERRSSSAKRAEKKRKRSSLKNVEKSKKILDKQHSSKTIGDPKIFHKILTVTDDDIDNSDWDDEEDEIKRKRPQTMQIFENGNGSANFNKLKRKRQSVDDMIIDNYFGDQPIINRVHSRIPDHRQRKNAASNIMRPASFKRFQQSKSCTQSHIIVSDKNSEKLQNRRSRDHLLHSHKKKKHQSVHIVSRKKNIYDDDIKLEVTPRRNSLDFVRKNKSKHVKGTQSVMDFAMIQSMQSEPVMVTRAHNNNKHSHSRFASVTNAIYKGWNFAKNKKKKNVQVEIEKKNQKNINAIFGIDPLTLNSTLIGGKDYACPIPNVLIKLREHLFKNEGHLAEGIFRVAPNATECKKIETELNDGRLREIDFAVIDGVLIANLIKIFFRYLPNPILQNIDGCKIEQIQNTHDANEVSDIINNDIEEPNKSYFKWLLDLCIEVIKHKDVNKMSCKNMAVVISPNLFDPSKIQNPMKAMTISTATVSFLQVAIQWREEQESDDK